MKCFKSLFKIIFTLFVFVFINSAYCFADILPYAVSDIPSDTLGLYQTDKRLVVYEKPDFKSKVIVDKELIYSQISEQSFDSVFAVLIKPKELGYMYVSDVSDDENWLEVIYDIKNNKKGWTYKNDDFQFMPWVDFINLYGRKYGLYQLKSQNNPMELFSNPDEKSQIIDKCQRTKQIKLISLEGNWLLVSVLDYSGNFYTGYIIWQNKNGELILFPKIR